MSVNLNKHNGQAVSVEVLNRHNQHQFLTFEDWELKKERVERRVVQEKRDAEWEQAQGWKRHNLPRGSEE